MAEAASELVVRSLFGGIPEELPEELFQPLLEGRAFRMQRILSRGQASPPGYWYDQDEHEWVLVLQGAARLGFEGASEELGVGDSLHIPAHRRHRVEWTAPDQDTVWLAIFYR